MEQLSLKTSRNKRVQVTRAAHLKAVNRIDDLEGYVRMLEARIAKLEDIDTQEIDVPDESAEADPVGLAELRASIKEVK